MKLAAILTVFLMLISIAYAGAEEYSSSINKPVELTKGCLNSTYANITVIHSPNGSIVLSGQTAMTKKVTDYYAYTYTPKDFGVYSIYGHCNQNGAYTLWNYDLKVTVNGHEFTTAQSITYALMVLIVFLILASCIYAFMTIQAGNIRNEDGKIIQINWKKYLRWFSLGIAYVCVVAISYFAWNISYAYLHFDALANFFRMTFRITLGLALPLFIVVGIISLITYLQDKKWDEMLQRGLSPR